MTSTTSGFVRRPRLKHLTTKRSLAEREDAVLASLPRT
jgi:hypothetical protein